MAERTIAQENAVTALANERIKAKAEAAIDADYTVAREALRVKQDDEVVAIKKTRDDAKLAVREA